MTQRLLPRTSATIRPVSDSAPGYVSRYPSATVPPTNIEKLFSDISLAIAEQKESGDESPWTVNVHPDPGGLPASTLVQLLKVLVPEGYSFNAAPCKPAEKGPYRCVDVYAKPSGTSTGKISAAIEDGSVTVEKGDAIPFGSGRTQTPNAAAMLTRPGMFPPGPPLYRVRTTSVGLFSVTPVEVNMAMVKDVLRAVKVPGTLVIFDGTASTGGDVINTIYNLSGTANAPDVFIVANEIDPVNHNALTKNIELYGYAKHVQTFNQDTLNLLSTPKKFRSPHVMYFDPPWGGHGYKTAEIVDLFLGDLNIFTLALHLAEDVANYPDLQLIVIKAPFNYNKKHPHLPPQSVLKSAVYDLRAAKNITYLFIDIKRYRETLPSPSHEDEPPEYHAPREGDVPIEEYVNPHVIREAVEYTAKKIRGSSPNSPEYDNYFISQPFRSQHAAWIRLSFLANTVPRLTGIGKLSLQRKKDTRMYFFPQPSAYETVARTLYRTLWARGYDCTLSFATQTFLEDAKLPVIILDARIYDHGTFLEFLESVVRAKVDGSDRMSDLVPKLPNIDAMPISTVLYPVSIVDRSGNERVLGIASAENLNLFGVPSLEDSESHPTPPSQDMLASKRIERLLTYSV